jgi:hypothetical protein
MKTVELFRKTPSQFHGCRSAIAITVSTDLFGEISVNRCTVDNNLMEIGFPTGGRAPFPDCKMQT